MSKGVEEIESERKSMCESSKELNRFEHVLFDTGASPKGVFESVGGCA